MSANKPPELGLTVRSAHTTLFLLSQQWIPASSSVPQARRVDRTVLYPSRSTALAEKFHQKAPISRVIAHAVALFLLLVVPSISARAAKVTVDDLMRLRSISDVRISPDGQHIAYVISTPSIEHVQHEAVLYVVPAAGGTPVRLTYATRIFNVPVPLPNLRWSPDGSRLGFIGLVDGVPQVMAISVQGGEAWTLTSLEQGTTTFEWSPDGKRIAFIAADAPSAETTKRRKDKSFVIAVDRDPHFPRVWVQDVKGGAPQAVTPLEHYVLDLSWSPDNKQVLYTASKESGFNSRYKCDVYTVPANGGPPKPIVERLGMNRGPQMSPDGKWIAFISTGGVEAMMESEDLYVVAANGSADTIRNLTKEREAWIGEYIWAPDSRSLLFIPDEQTNETGDHMFEQPITRVSLDNRHIEVLTNGPVVNYSVTFSDDGSRIGYRQVHPRDMGEVYSMDVASRKATRLTEVNPELRNLDLGVQKAVHWTSFDGKEIWGLLLTPPGYHPGTRIPMVVYCHGGPIGGYTYGIFPQFMHRPGQVDPYPVEAMASEGMAILFPMPRGGSGYGIAGFKAIINSWGESDYKDIMAGVDWAVKEGIADPDRLGVMGASYGGFMTSWIVTQTDRFKAASTAASVNDLVQEYYLSDAGDFIVEYFGTPWEAADVLAKHSPITFAANVKTPLLIQHGESDNRVPLGQARAFYKALKAQHKTVEFDIYPRGGHVNYEPPLEREYMLRNLGWFKKWLMPVTAAAK